MGSFLGWSGIFTKNTVDEEFVGAWKEGAGVLIKVLVGVCKG
jgi:hypothetical protein